MPDYITDEERRLIEEALQAGKVQIIPLGKTSFAGYEWDEQQRQLRQVEPKKISATINGTQNEGIKRLNHYRSLAAQQREAHVEALLNSGMNKAVVSSLTGISRRRINHMLERMEKRKGVKQ